MACLTLVAACAGEDGPGDTSEADLPEFSGDSEVMAEVGTKGASLLLGKDVSLRIPAGALEEPVDVRVTRVDVGDLEAGEPEEIRASDLVRFEPHGQEFRMPVEIEVRVTRDEGSDSELRMARLDDEQDTDWERVGDTRVLQPADEDELEGMSGAERERRGSRRVQARTMRFSIYTAIVDPAADGAAEMDGGTGEDSQAAVLPDAWERICDYIYEQGCDYGTLTLADCYARDEFLGPPTRMCQVEWSELIECTADGIAPIFARAGCDLVAFEDTSMGDSCYREANTLYQCSNMTDEALP